MAHFLLDLTCILSRRDGNASVPCSHVSALDRDQARRTYNDIDLAQHRVAAPARHEPQ
jgi:hypothetical protein